MNVGAGEAIMRSQRGPSQDLRWRERALRRSNATPDSPAAIEKWRGRAFFGSG